MIVLVFIGGALFGGAVGGYGNGAVADQQGERTGGRMRHTTMALAWAALVVCMVLLSYHFARIPDNVDMRGEAKYRALRALGEGE